MKAPPKIAGSGQIAAGGEEIKTAHYYLPIAHFHLRRQGSDQGWATATGLGWMRRLWGQAGYSEKIKETGIWHIGRAHSCRNAIIGFTLVARRAGIQHASNATSASSSAIEPNVNGSLALTPNNKDFIKRVSANAPASPMARPINTSFIPCPITSRKTSRPPAPSAMRTPIS